MPLVASVPNQETCRGRLYQPFAFDVVLKSPVTVGGTASILIVSVFSFSTFPALSVELKASVWIPSPVIEIDPEYGVGKVPSREYDVPAIPDMLSVVAIDAETGDLNQSLFPAVPVGVAVVTGGVLSMLMPDTVMFAELPALSVAVPVTCWPLPSVDTV